MNPVFVLDFNDDNLSDVSNPIQHKFSFTRAAPEPGASHHWVFDQGSNGSLTDLVAGKILTPEHQSYRHTRNSLIINSSPGHSLLTDIVDPVGGIIFFVARKPTGGKGIFCGNVNGSPVNSRKGWGINAVEDDTIYVRSRTTDADKNYTSFIGSGRYEDVENGEWFFMAGYIGPTTDGLSDKVAGFLGPSAYIEVMADPYVPANLPFALGNHVFHGHPMVDSELEFAEFGYIPNTVLDAGRGEEIFAHAQTRMIERGIVLFNDPS